MDILRIAYHCTKRLTVQKLKGSRQAYQIKAQIYKYYSCPCIFCFLISFNLSWIFKLIAVFNKLKRELVAGVSNLFAIFNYHFL